MISSVKYRTEKNPKIDIYIETKQQEQITAYQSGVIQIPNTEI